MRYYIPKFVATPQFFVFTIVVFLSLAGFYSQLQFVQELTNTWKLSIGIGLATGTYLGTGLCFAILQVLINACVYLKDLLVESLPRIRNYRTAPPNCEQVQEYCYSKYFGCKTLLFNGVKPHSPTSFSSSPTAGNRLEIV